MKMRNYYYTLLRTDGSTPYIKVTAPNFKEAQKLVEDYEAKNEIAQCYSVFETLNQNEKNITQVDELSYPNTVEDLLAENAKLKEQIADLKISESAMLDWHKFGDYLYKKFGKDEYCNMVDEADVIKQDDNETIQKHAELRVKADQLDTILNCERIRIIGTAREHDQGRTGSIRHVGMELWSTHPDVDDSKSRDILMDFLNKTIKKSDDPFRDPKA
jgi:hypothetical protein